ncbi:hypothetical protein [Streptomyces oceani]|uniref:Uncharacterized protein n=1 Tax=Streptomyces oceani TaxID=1075402 RepID=A0A1E7KLL8_9ACTN|nr:hypothetical protein [Streptomyces oceani]OEV04790.1 hypothetical protein AN216_05835 [Streptomyces oceani]
MALNRKGSRRITVDGIAYRWRVRHKPAYAQSLCWTPLTYAVELADREGPGTTLVVSTGQSHPSNWMGAAATSVRPAQVAAGIRGARAAGWLPARPGSPFRFDGSADFVPSP